MKKGKKERAKTLKRLKLNERDYFEMRKDADGCYELLRRLIELKVNIFNNSLFVSVDDKFADLLEEMETEGKDISKYRKKYEALFKDYDSRPIVLRSKQKSYSQTSRNLWSRPKISSC